MTRTKTFEQHAKLNHQTRARAIETVESALAAQGYSRRERRELIGLLLGPADAARVSHAREMHADAALLKREK